MSQNLILRQNDEIMDSIEAAMIANLPQVDCPVAHLFTPNLYVREIFMAKDTLVTSKIHKSTHPFTISKGKVAVSIDGGKWEVLEAPYTSVTLPGTRRLLYIIEDCVWSTYHALSGVTGEENTLSKEEKMKVVTEIESVILEPYNNNILVNMEKQLIC